MKAFDAAYGAKFPKAAAKITDDVEELLAYYGEYADQRHRHHDLEHNDEATQRAIRDLRQDVCELRGQVGGTLDRLRDLKATRDAGPVVLAAEETGRYWIWTARLASTARARAPGGPV